MTREEQTLQTAEAESVTKYSRRELLRASASAVLTFSGSILWPGEAGAARPWILDFYSPRNTKRPKRPHTLYIVLHTTEGEEQGSLSKVRRFGEIHYFVCSSGLVYRIIDKLKIATHAGRSMWEGNTAIDHYAIGIEVSGYHDTDINRAQYTALRELLDQLKRLFGITDENVVTHSMVAYGRPNIFHHNNHRGRKRCGMIFAHPAVRARLGLEAKPGRDEDVVAGRLKIGDPELHSFLFAKAPRSVAAAAAGTKAGPAPTITTPAGSNVIDEEWTAWSIARERYHDPETTYLFPDGRRLRGDQIQNWGKIPKDTRVTLAAAEEVEGFEGFLEIGKDGDTAQDLAGDAYDGATSIYFFPDGLIRTGAELKKRQSTRMLLNKLPLGTRVLVGYVYGGHVKTRRLASSIAGVKWNYPSTYYRFSDGTIVSGDQVDDSAIPAGTLIFYQH